MRARRLPPAWRLAVVLLLLAPRAAPAADAPATATVDRSRLEDDVRRLCAPDLGGRASAAQRLAASAVVAERMTAAGLAPVPRREGLILPVLAGDGRVSGRNVAGFLPGREAGEYVVLGAHYDGPGSENGTAAPAADEATGVAAALEAARVLARGPRARRGLLVVAFDLFAARAAGSRAFVAEPPLDLAGCAAFVEADRLGRSAGDALPGVLFALGAQRSDAIASILTLLRPPAGIALRPLGADFGIEPWTDALAFEERGVPTLRLTAGESPAAGTPADTADRLDGAALAGRVQVLLDVVKPLLDAPTRPVRRDSVPPSLDEMRTVKALLSDLAAREGAPGWDERRRVLRRSVAAVVDGILARGTVTVGERASVRLLCVQLLSTLAQRE